MIKLIIKLWDLMLAMLIVEGADWGITRDYRQMGSLIC